MDKQKEQIQKEILGIESIISSTEHLIRVITFETEILKKVNNIEEKVERTAKISKNQSLIALLKERLESDQKDLEFNKKLLNDIFND